MWSGVGLPLGLTAIGAVGCFVNSSWDLTVGSVPGPVPLTLPVIPTLHGAVFFAQGALLGDPFGQLVVTTSSAQATVIGQ